MSTPFNNPFQQLAEKTAGMKLQPPAGGEGKKARLNRRERRKAAALAREANDRASQKEADRR